jgi:hypothetical protein
MYLKYVIRHKWFVLRACRKTGTSLWRGLIHDLSKFRPSEWGPYVRTFYAPDGSKQYKETEEFAVAWNLHQKRNKHHWQAWLLTWDRGETVALRMPDKYVREMVADWIGAGLAITGKVEVCQWYEKNKTKMILHPDTRTKVETLLKELFT